MVQLVLALHMSWKITSPYSNYRVMDDGDPKVTHNQTLQSRIPNEREKADATQSSRVESEYCIGNSNYADVNRKGYSKVAMKTGLTNLEITLNRVI